MLNMIPVKVEENNFVIFYIKQKKYILNLLKIFVFAQMIV